MAAAKARWNSMLRLIWVREARRLVTEVPILAPIIIGMALGMVSAPPATRPTTMDVVDDEDWMIDVARIPIKSPTIGFVVVSIRLDANPFPNNFKDAPINSRLKRKR
jgi:hypothetical protein